MSKFPQISSFLKRNPENTNYDWLILGIVIVISLCGVAFVGSAIVTRLEVNPTPTTFLGEFFKQLLLGFWFGGVLAFIFSQIDYHKLFAWKNPILLGTLFLLSTLSIPIIIARIAGISAESMFSFFDSLPIRPRHIENAGRWIAIGNKGGFTFQPAEIAKLAILIYFSASIQALNQAEIVWDNFKKPFYAFFITAFMIVIQPDLGSVVMLLVILGSSLWISKINKNLILSAIVCATLFVAITIFSVDYRRERFFAWFNTTVAAQQENTSNLSTDDIEGFRQIASVQRAIQNGGIFGKGYGQGEFKKSVPHVSSDAIIAVIGEEAGFVFTTLFLSLYLAFFFRAMHIAKHAADAGGRSLAVGIGVWILFQAFWNVAGITGLVPLKGLPLPFISEGGTAIAVNLAAIGILLNVSAQSDLKEETSFIKKFNFNPSNSR